MDWAQILVIILSVFLAVFLLVAIILVVLLIKVTHQIKTVTNSAMRTVEHVESAAAGLSKFSSSVFILGVVKKIFKKQQNVQTKGQAVRPENKIKNILSRFIKRK